MNLALLSLLLFAVSGVAGYALRGEKQSPEEAGEGVPSKSARLQQSEKLPDEIEQRLAPIRGARDGEAKLLAVLDLAARLPDDELGSWYDAGHLGFLDLQLRSLFRGLIGARWLEADPAGFTRWWAQYEYPAMGPYFDRWLEVDEPGAIQFVEQLSGAKRTYAAVGLVQAVGKKDVPRALALLKGFEDDESIPFQMMDAVLSDLVRKDRDAVLRHVLSHQDGRRLRGLHLLMAHGGSNDRPWILSLVEREGVSWRELGYEPDELTDNPGEEFPSTVKRIPKGWLKRDLLSKACPPGDYGAVLRLREVEGFSREQLHETQKQVLMSGIWKGPGREEAIELAEQGTWLSTELRSELASRVVHRWEGDLEEARAWVATLDDELRTSVSGRLEEMIQTKARRRLESKLKDPREVVRVLADSGERLRFGKAADRWKDEDVALAVSEVRRLPVEEAAAVVERYGVMENLPVEMAVAFADRVLGHDSPGQVASGEKLGSWVRNTATRWAREVPAPAGEWVLRLPVGETRRQAVEAVAAEWVRYSQAEVRAWAERLEPDEQEKIGNHLE